MTNERLDWQLQMIEAIGNILQLCLLIILNVGWVNI
jgi:hypothetical protein